MSWIYAWLNDRSTYKNSFLDNFSQLMMLLAPYLLEPFSPPSVHGLTHDGDDAIGGQSRRVLPASLPQRTGRNPSLTLLTIRLPQIILSTRGVCRVSGHTTAMTDKAKVTSWSQAQPGLISASQEVAPASVHRSMHLIIMTCHKILTCNNMKYVVFERFNGL